MSVVRQYKPSQFDMSSYSYVEEKTFDDESLIWEISKFKVIHSWDEEPLNLKLYAEILGYK